MNSPVVKRSIMIDGHRTSVSLEDAFWKALKSIAAKHSVSVSSLVAAIHGGRHRGNLSSTLRLYVLSYYQSASCKQCGVSEDESEQTESCVP